MGDTGQISEELQERVLDAARTELLESGIDRFGIDCVARRAGVAPELIRSHWHDRRVLLMEALLVRTAKHAWNPDTGSLHTDLEAVAALAVELSQNAPGRALFQRVLASSGDADLAEVATDLWAARFQDAAQMLERAANRGQLRDGVIPIEAIRMFTAAFYYDVIFSDVPVRPEYAEQAVDIFLHGVLGAGGRDRPWNDLNQLLRAEGEREGGSAADLAVEAARRSLMLMRVWADALPDPVVLYEAVRDDEGRLVDLVCRDINRAGCEEVGLTRSDLVGRRLLETLPLFAESGLMAEYEKCIDGGGPVVLNGVSYLHFDVERHLDIRATSAGADLITVTWRDVTERHESAQRDERYRKLMDFSVIPVALTTPDGHLVSVNQAMATLFGYDIDTLLTKNWEDITAPEALEEERLVLADMIAGRRDTYRGDKQYLHADGHRIKADLALSCIRRPDGEVENLIAQIIDMTDR